MLHTQDLFWHKELRTLSADISDIKHIADLNTNTMNVVSSHTGRQVSFKFAKHLKTRDNEVYGWEYFDNSNVNIRLVIYND